MFTKVVGRGKALVAVVTVGAVVGGGVLAPEASASPAAPLTATSMMSTVRDLVDMGPRTTGSPAGRRASDYVAQRFRDAGLTDVHFEEVTSYDWKPSNAGLRVGATAVDAFPVSHSFIPADAGPGVRSTGANGLTAPVVDIGRGKIDGRNVRGKIVMFDLAFMLPTAGLLPLAEYINDPDGTTFDPDVMLSANPYLTSLESTIRAAQNGGAVGFVGVLSDYFNSNRYHNEYYRKLAMRIPGMWVTRSAGARMRGLLAKNRNRARIDLTVTRSAVTGRTVIGMLPGATTDTVMVQSHHDSVTTGAVEDATGTAEVIALAEHYGRLARTPGKRPRRKSMMFATFDTHFTGYQSHQAFVDKYIVRKQSKWNIVANTTIEHVGRRAKRASNGKLVTTDQPETKGLFENVNLALKADLASSLTRNNVRSTTMLNAAPFQLIQMGIPTDASFLLVAGVPVVSFISGPLYMYDDADTIDKVDVGQMAPVARFFRDTLDRLDREPGRAIGLIPGSR
ncbi:M28 family peptidase [Gordonia sp. MMO-8]|uniref:M28 family peptidase n=1 Tax=Gordonia sp. MMO-8 TaxID=3127886 RepID=UPI00301A2E80